MNKILSFGVMSLVIMATSLGINAQGLTPLQEEYQLHIHKTDDAIRVDGQLDEAVWQTAERATNFWMSFPIDDRRAVKENQTEAMITYDDKFIYVAAICHGAGPYVMPSLKRDARAFWQGDAFGVVFDPVNEKTNGFNFNANSSGVQSESLITGQTGTRGSGGGSQGVNGAWDNIWISEVQILEDRWTIEIAIPFKSLRFNENKIWGINFLRGHSATNSYHMWSPVPVQFRGVDLGYTGALVWDESPVKSKSNISIIPYALTSTFKDIENNEPSDNNFQIGGDAKIAISSGLNLDLTLNPDFSQVDVDEQVTNLTTVNIRFPERRLFFLENSDLYSDFGIPPMRPFFSRRIGLDDDGNAIPITYGARLSGNINKDLRIGVMNLQTKAKDEFLGQNYTSVTAHQQVFGRSIVKGYFHNRQAYREGDFLDDDFNRTAGLEYSYRSGDGRWQAFGGYGKSWSHQLNNDNYFYNVAVGFDSRTIGFYTNLAGIGNNYRADMGFIPRAQHYDAVEDRTHIIGFNHGFTRASYKIFPTDNSTINAHTFSARNVLDYTKDGWDLIQNITTVAYNLSMANSSRFELSVSHEEQGLIFPFGFTSENPLPAGKYVFNYVEAEYRSDSRKFFSYSLGVRRGGFFNGDRSEYSVDLRYRAQPWGNFSVRFVQNDLVFPEEFGETKLFLVGPKFELNFSRDLFWTTFLQYNTQRENFNINSRIQWRFKPLSDLFIVYTDNYATDIWGPKNRGLVIKMNYWLNL